MKQALIIIDFVNDFVDSGGSLTCGAPAQQIDEQITGLVKEFSERGDFLVIANDVHTDGDKFNPESRSFPPHCITGTWGGTLYGETNKAVKMVSDEQKITIPKSRYSAFCGTDLDLKLRERMISTISLVGVCSDICVLHTAIDAYNLGYAISVYENGIASFDETGHRFAIQHFKNVLGATIL